MRLNKIMSAAVTFAIFAPGAAASASQQTGTVSYVVTDQNTANPMLFYVDGTRTTKPACATDGYWAISSPSNDAAKAMFANVLTALNSKKTIVVTGTGFCDPQQTARESVSYIIVGP